MIKKQFSKTAPVCTVTFSLTNDQVGKHADVRVLGTFNDWSWDKGLTLGSKKKGYEGSLDLATGAVYEFRYLVNGQSWFNDETADDYLPTPFFSHNCVLAIEGVAAPKAAKAAKAPRAPKAEATEKVAKAPGRPRTPKADVAETVAKAPRKPRTPKADATEKVAKGPGRPRTPKADATETVAKAPGRPRTLKADAPEKVAKTPGRPRTPKADATEAVAKAPRKPRAAKVAAPVADDLKKIEGVGPKIAKLLIAEGITTFADLAKAQQPQLKAILVAAGTRFKLHDATTWPEQAALAAAGKWDELAKLQAELDGGQR